MKLLNKITNHFSNSDFDLDYETDMVQSRILSPIIDAYEKRGMTQSDLSEKTGLSQSFISSIFNIRKRLNMKHVALLQHALEIVLQKPEVLEKSKHNLKYHSKDEFFKIQEQKVALQSYIANNLRQFYTDDYTALTYLPIERIDNSEVLLGSLSIDEHQKTHRKKATFKGSRKTKWKKMASASI